MQKATNVFGAWADFFKQAGLNDVTSWRANQPKDWAGTLVLTRKK